jgi:hypothetical protein
MKPPDIDFALADQEPIDAAPQVERLDDEIPEFLRVQNRMPLTPEQQAAVGAKIAAAKTANSSNHQDELRQAQMQTKRESAKIKRAAKAEKAADVLAAAPLTGKAALAATSLPSASTPSLTCSL